MGCQTDIFNVNLIIIVKHISHSTSELIEIFKLTNNLYMANNVRCIRTKQANCKLPLLWLLEFYKHMVLLFVIHKLLTRLHLHIDFMSISGNDKRKLCISQNATKSIPMKAIFEFHIKKLFEGGNQNIYRTVILMNISLQRWQRSTEKERSV